MEKDIKTMIGYARLVNEGEEALARKRARQWATTPQRKIMLAIFREMLAA